MPIRNPVTDFAQTLQQMSTLGRRRRLTVQCVSGPYLLDDHSNRLLNFGGNDYLGVVADRLTNRLLTSEGTPDAAPGATASALVCGWTPQHDQLAREIARVEKTEAAVIFPSGYAACSGTVATLCRENDLILSDQLNHASLIDGCRASKAHCEVYPHRDVAFIEDFLNLRRSDFRHVWIVTDGVFSMDGDAAPLDKLVPIAAKHDGQLLVDEAHGTGVLGTRGGGLCEAMGLQDQIAIRIGTLSKAIGHQGGFVAGPQVVIDYLIQFCRTLIFSTALAPQTAAGACEVVTTMAEWNDRRLHVAHLAAHLRERIAALHAPQATASNTNASDLERGIPIVPIIIGGDQDAVDLSGALRQRGFYVPAIRPPTVPEGTARLRVSLSAAHQLEHVDSLVDNLIETRAMIESGRNFSP
ncbi:aminotransferase class I/II-fold pyridoxal phosphate-dependent enzyme [Aporhodopirellula aestuarii]|uniref:8-amino-7-oxononanoate synthase n=1 Tax=Aporhodopirellula aestuarii TaxID=2950107 RepID=A0ABT0UE03_9BACT|nr:8-amino-7-oxononanoate synthase [Aporhodopirellula aestuarii]MCM2374960.1 8-amino-7-oxononanoate synthase [Aporhodopirellula aestuarii]